MSKRAPSLKEALKIPCSKCGGSGVYDWESSEHHMIHCEVCGHETLISVRLHDVTRNWKFINEAKT